MSTPELGRLQAAQLALGALPATGAAAPLRGALRALARAADDAEAAADEAAGAARADLLRAVAEARAAADATRAAAKDAAREDVRAGRRELLFEGAADDRGEHDASAAKIAEDITAGLRRVTGIVQEEVDRSAATGDIVDDSSKRLRQTRDVHKGYKDHLDSGAETLRMLQREERNANIFLALCFFAFFFFAFYIAQRRVANSNTSAYIVTPIYRVTTFVPRRMLRLLSYAARVAFRKSSPSASPEPAVPTVIGSDAEPSARQPDAPAVETTKSPGMTTARPAVMPQSAKRETENDKRSVMSSSSGIGSDQVPSEPIKQESSVRDESTTSDSLITEVVRPPTSGKKDDGSEISDDGKAEL